MSGLLPFFGTWNPAADDSNRPESPDPHETFDDDDPEFQEESESTYSTLLAGMIPSFASFHADKTKKASNNAFFLFLYFDGKIVPYLEGISKL